MARPIVAAVALIVWSLVSPANVILAAQDEKPPTDHATSGQTLDEARTGLKTGEYSRAESIARSLLPEVEGIHGVDSLETAEVLDVIVEALWLGGKSRNPETKAFAEKAIRIKEALLGIEHEDLIKSLSNLGIVYFQVGDYSKAEEYFRRSLRILENTPEADDELTAWTYSNLGSIRWRTGDYAEAKELYERALAIRERVFGAVHPGVAACLVNLALVSSSVGDNEETTRLYERALEIQKETLGPDHPNVADSLSGLAGALMNDGHYALAEERYQEAYEIRKKRLGDTHPRIANSLKALAELRWRLGDFVEARRLYEEALHITESAYGPDHFKVADILNEMGFLLMDTGSYEDAIEIYERCVRIIESSVGSEHAAAAICLNNLAQTHQLLQNYETATEIYLRSQALLETALGPDHPSVGQGLNNLGKLQALTGKTDDAKLNLSRALSIYEASLGGEHPDVAIALTNLAELFVNTGESAKAKPLFARALEIQRKSLGPDHPEVAATLTGLAGALWLSEDRESALLNALEVERIGRLHLQSTGMALPERELLQYAAIRASGLDLAFTIVLESDTDPQSRFDVCDALVRSRSLVLDQIAARHRSVGVSDNPEITRLFDEFASATQELARLTVKGPDEGSAGTYREMLDGVRKKRERSERALAEKSSAFAREQGRILIGLDELRMALPEDAALVAYAMYSRYERGSSPEQTEPVSGGTDTGAVARRSASYLACIVRKDHETPILVPLGAASGIDDAVARWHDEVSRGVFIPDRTPSQSEEAYRGAAKQLDSQVWNPIVEHLSSMNRVIVVPDGALNLVSFAALPAGDRYLVEAGPLVHYMSAERDLIPVSSSDQRAEGLLALGNPDYQRVASSAVPVPTSFRGERSACGDFSSMLFGPLPETAKETTEITAIWRRSREARSLGPASHLTGAQASEAEFKNRAPGHRVLHLATHGFFLGGRCASTTDSARGIGGLAVTAGGSDSGGTEPPGTADNPLLLSGLALAGANNRASVGPEEEDGILTAQEVAALDLSSVEWAVLSACDTGVGEIRAGEGVFGLRRAFQIAGAKTLIMSLWPVDDASTGRWMEELYKARIKAGKGTAECVRQASLEVLRWRRRHDLSTHPFYWAGFVAAGA
jgi:CHAT domain-containing protein/tetratricopeptide (TPR) repeat protein